MQGWTWLVPDCARPKFESCNLAKGLKPGAMPKLTKNSIRLEAVSKTATPAEAREEHGSQLVSR